MLGGGEIPTTVPDLAKVKNLVQICLDIFRRSANIAASHTVQWFLSELGNTAERNESATFKKRLVTI
jgi:hypothetical protein